MPGAGPIVLFDKSVLQSLTVDESVWFDTFYFPSITPLFFVETLGDLEKELQKGRTPEDVVGNLAEKTPLGGGVNVHHQTLGINELLGQKFELRHVPVVAGGRPVRTPSGTRGVVYDESPESRALSRWREHRFLEAEHEFARNWRDALSAIDLDALYTKGREIIKRFGRPADLARARDLASQILRKPRARYVVETFETLHPSELANAVLNRWKSLGSPPIREFAPYAAHVYLVDLFFCIAVGADLIGRERPTNKIDMAYLYYLPFCMVFTSRDKLHERTAPLFLDQGQVFVRGDDLKADLAKLDAHYSQLSDEEKMKGVMSFAHYPPVEGEYLVSQLWDKLMSPDWRKQASEPREPMSKEEQAKIIAEINKIAEAPRARDGANSDEELSAVLVQRSIPLYRGKWRMVSPEVEKSSRGES